MKKSLIALAVLAASGAAMAQSSVTLFGVVDASATLGRGSIADKNAIGTGGYNSSRLGFRGTEDLGGGLAASFWLEAGFNSDNGSGVSTSTGNQVGGATTGSGALAFNRRSTVSFSGAFGEVRVGRDYTPQFKNLDAFDPFGTNGVGQNVLQDNPYVAFNPTLVRASNSVSYLLPSNLGGFYGQVQGFVGENVKNGGPNQASGNGGGARVGFANGPLDIALVASVVKAGVVNAVAPSTGIAGTGLTSAGDVKTASLGASYDFGVFKLLSVYSQDTLDDVTAVANRSGDDVKGRGLLVGATAPIGAGLIRFSVATYRAESGDLDLGRQDKIALGYVHNLSKRTALYTTVAHLRNKDGSSYALGGSATRVNGNSTGYDVGVRHAF